MSREDKYRHCDNEHLRDYPGCFEECDQDVCIGGTAVTPPTDEGLRELLLAFFWKLHTGEINLDSMNLEEQDKFKADFILALVQQVIEMGRAKKLESIKQDILGIIARNEHDLYRTRDLLVKYLEQVGGKQMKAEQCPNCNGTGKWATECCDGSHGCSCHGQSVDMGTCLCCHGTGLKGTGYNRDANVNSIRGMSYIGSSHKRKV